MSKPMTMSVWITLTDERWVPITYDGTVLLCAVLAVVGFASPTVEGLRKFRALFRTMSAKAKAPGYRKAMPFTTFMDIAFASLREEQMRAAGRAA